MTEPQPPRPAAAPAAACPICGAPAVARFRPFCSARCADRDLHRWLGEVYRLPAEAPAADEFAADDDFLPPGA